MSRTATIVIAGITITAPLDLVSAAGYEPATAGPSRSRWPIAEQRLLRAMSEQSVLADCEGPAAVKLLLRVAELADIERAAATQAEQLRRIAQTEAKAAADERAAAGMALAHQARQPQR